MAEPGKHLGCAYCGDASPDNTHLDGHNHTACLDRPMQDKTFYRKDHLVQHLHTVHRVSFNEELMQSWMLVGPEIRSRCGFCDALFDSWTTRVEHLAGHFRDGQTMSNWKGDWGFETNVVYILENAMPPCKSYPLKHVDSQEVASH